jgi:hypothetical protein
MACLNRSVAARPRNEISELRCSGDEPIVCKRLTLVLFATANDEEGAVMMNRNAARSTDHFTMGRVAYVVERFSLAVTGALCGLFVAAHLAKANVDVFDSVGLVFAMIRFGIIGFHIGNDVPPRPSRPTQMGISDVGLSPRVDVAELLRAAGAFLATVAALVSVYVVVFDEVLPAIWIIIVGLCWLFGATMQIFVGIRARMTLARRETARRCRATDGWASAAERLKY